LCIAQVEVFEQLFSKQLSLKKKLDQAIKEVCFNRPNYKTREKKYQLHKHDGHKQKKLRWYEFGGMIFLITIELYIKSYSIS